MENGNHSNDNTNPSPNNNNEQAQSTEHISDSEPIPNGDPAESGTQAGDSSRPGESQGTQADGETTRRRERSLKTVAWLIIGLDKSLSGVRAKSPQNMCGTCQSLELDVDKFIIREHSSDRRQQAYRSILPPTNKGNRDGKGLGSGKFNMGKYKDIKMKSKDCPLCSLIIESVEDFDYPMDLDELHSAECFLSWQLDGREASRDPIGRITSVRARTRRIQLRWDNRKIQDSYLVLAAPEKAEESMSEDQWKWESATQFLGRYLKIAGNNVSMVKSWLDLCEHEHGELCRIERDPKFEEMRSRPYFGVVDVHEMRLTQLPSGERYLALSYVWGGKRPYRTTLANIHAHQTHAGLQKVFPFLPQAIQDAILLTRQLRERYIWIDSLCIVQDSDISWNLNALSMDLVYGNAYLTICAADGEGSHVGLNALFHPKQRLVSQHYEKCAENLVLMVTHLAENYIKRSRWNTRGWTFQERLLSKKCLIFTADRVYFQCNSSVMSEDVIGEQKNTGWSMELVQAPHQMTLELSTRAFWVYMECVRLYTARTLGRPGDVLAAFNGMGNLFKSKMGASLVFGLPSSHFDLAVLWQPQYASIRRESRDSRSRSADFPSWSWCGWRAEVDYDKEMLAGCLSNVYRWSQEHTWIEWHIRDSNGNLRPIWHYSAAAGEDPNTESRWRGYGRSGLTVRENDALGYDSYGRVIKPDYQNLDSWKFEQTLPDYPFCVSQARPSSSPSNELPHERFLQFYTWSAFLRLVPHEQSETEKLGTKRERYDIADYTGDWCGSIVIDWGWARMQTPGGEQEFIALSDAFEFTDAECTNWNFYIPRERESSEWDLYYVLLITTKNGISQRRGLGKVFKEAFMNCCIRERKWREVILE